jgi:hypothetical protein
VFHFFIPCRVMSDAKEWWGPRVWLVLHSLAEISGRTDCGPAWRNVLLTTADMIPCALCRSHFRTHVSGMRFPIGQTMFPYLRDKLWAIHAETGGNLPAEQLATLYGGTRAEVIERVLPVISEIVGGLGPTSAMDGPRRAALGAWNRAVYALIALLRNDQVDVSSGRRRR